MKTFVSLLISVVLSQVVHAEGGGVTSGDGFPKRVVPQVLEKYLPVANEIWDLIRKISRKFPTFGARLTEVLLHFQEGRYTVVRLQGTNPDFFAHFESDRDSENRLTGARILLWDDFFSLPLSDEMSEKPTQVRILFHELIHIAITQTNDALTKKIAHLAESVGDRKKELELARILETIPLGAGDFQEVKKHYLASYELNEECSDLDRSDPVQLGDRQVTFPLLPSAWGGRETLTLDPFFKRYRDYCFMTLPIGQTLAGNISPTAFTLSYITHGAWIEGLTGERVVIHLRNGFFRKGWGYMLGLGRNQKLSLYNAFPSLRLLLDVAEFASVDKPLSAKDISERVEGYGQWLEAVLLTHVRSELDFGAVAYDLKDVERFLGQTRDFMNYEKGVLTEETWPVAVANPSGSVVCGRGILCTLTKRSGRQLDRFTQVADVFGRQMLDCSAKKVDFRQGQCSPIQTFMGFHVRF